MSTDTPARLWGSQRLPFRLGLPVAIAIAVSVLAIVASSNRSRPPRGYLVQSATGMQRTLAGLPQHGATLGDPAAPVTVTEFADLQCPYCDGFALTVLPRIIDAYVVPGKVKLAFRNFPFLGEDSVRAARMAVAAEDQNRMWGFVDAFYYDQKAENSGYVTASFLRSVGSSVPGLSVVSALNQSRTPSVTARLESDVSLGRSEHVRATPTFIITSRAHPTQRVVGFSQLTTELNRALTR